MVQKLDELLEETALTTTLWPTYFMKDVSAAVLPQPSRDVTPSDVVEFSVVHYNRRQDSISPLSNDAYGVLMKNAYGELLAEELGTEFENGGSTEPWTQITLHRDVLRDYGVAMQTKVDRSAYVLEISVSVRKGDAVMTKVKGVFERYMERLNITKEDAPS